MGAPPTTTNNNTTVNNNNNNNNNPGFFCPSLQEAHDHNIPFPRSSGARFCGDGHLVTFGWTRQYSVPVARDETDGPPLEEVARTPRALTSMLGVSNGAASPKYSQ